jgi:NADH:ubiquinone oxidoreductase subunit F (NADH-binding)/NADH:ubiquinone oxidoreductase subunit E
VAIPGSSLVKIGPEAHNTDGIFEDLKAVQRQYGYVPKEQMEAIAEARSLHVRDVHAVASFYPHFHLKAPARVDLRVCSDMSCHVRGACDLRADLEQRLRGYGEKEVSVREVSCLGRCDKAPAVMINDEIFDGVDAVQTANMVQDTLGGKKIARPRPPHLRTQLHSDPYSTIEARYGVLRDLTLSRDYLGVLAQLKASSLRGMGGAGFPTGTKWEAVRNAPGHTKYVVCNADESEPGTIKDRFIMQYLPHLLIEGMIIAGLVTGAKSGVLYIRHEYDDPKDALQEEIDHCYTQGILGSNILGSDLAFDLKIFVSPGGYICGEETALIEAIEGKRSEPRNKPPFPVISGLWNKPTALNNVETFVLATVILAKGVDWFKNYGKNGSSGIKFVGISGDVRNPGVFEVPMGISYDELINGYAGGPPPGKSIKGFAPSGPSSGYLPASMLHLPLDWNAMAKVNSMVGSGAIVVCGSNICMLDMALNAVKFYRNESCGKCVPCRVGSQKMVDMITEWTRGKYRESDMGLLTELSNAMRLTSICGLGQIVPAPIQSVIEHFREEVDAHILDQRCPADVCFRGGAA